jgi:hypothetical protein
VYAEHPDFHPPSDLDAVIWRYMDLPRFVALLDKEALYFPRADMFDDPHEGAMPAADIEARSQAMSVSTGGEQVEMQWAPGLSGPVDLSLITIRSTFINCWNLSDYESAALWSIYGKSVAIRSTYRGLRDAFRPEDDDEVYIGVVRYIDYAHDAMQGRRTDLARFVHKRLYFENEHELRAVVVNGKAWTTDFDDGTWQWNIDGDPRVGLSIPVDLETLIHEVYVAPEQPDWVREVTQAVCDRFGLERTVRRSSLDERPRY